MVFLPFLLKLLLMKESNNMNRHEARIIASLALYHYDITIDINSSITMSLSTVLTYVNENNYNLQFCEELAHGTIKYLEVIDNIITNNLINWTIDRLSYVDRAIIRLATYEMLYTTVAHPIIINEALEITREYSNLNDDTQIKFTNKLLDKISEVIKSEHSL